METKNIILKLRMQKGLSQDELAEKIMVTRQAVSRWENGETVPNTETLKLLSREFDVSINTLLGEPRKLICQCCGMPMELICTMIWMTRKRILEINWSLNSEETGVLAYWREWILSWYAPMRKAVKIRNY